MEDVLYDLIKEDRNEIRIIKNRMYTAIQALVVASVAVSAFFVERSTKEGDMDSLYASERWLIAGTNIFFLLISWVVVLCWRRDLNFVRRCLKYRECRLEERDGYDYFGTGENCEKEGSCLEECLHKGRNRKKGGFKNDDMPVFVQLTASLIYISILIGVLCL